MWRCSFLCPVRLTIAISSVIAALWLLGGKTGAGVRGILSRESSVTRPANPGEASMDYVHCICLAGVTKLDGNQWSIVLKYWKLLASWKEAPTLQGLTCRTELGCRWSGVISIPSSLPPSSLSLSLFVFFIQFNTERSLDGERISSFRSLSLSLSLCDLLIVMACRWATNPPWHAKSPSLLPPTGWRTYKTRSCRKSDIWNFHMLLHTIILLLSKSCRVVDCLFSVPFYATYLLLLHHGLAVLNALQKLALARGKCSGCARFYIIYVCIKMSTPSYRHLCEIKNNASECFERLRRQQFQLNLSGIANFFFLDYHKVYGLDNEKNSRLNEA